MDIIVLNKKMKPQTGFIFLLICELPPYITISNPTTIALRISNLGVKNLTIDPKHDIRSIWFPPSISFLFLVPY